MIYRGILQGCLGITGVFGFIFKKIKKLQYDTLILRCKRHYNLKKSFCDMYAFIERKKGSDLFKINTSRFRTKHKKEYHCSIKNYIKNDFSIFFYL